MGASSFNEMELDAIGEIMNISLGASATAVSTMLGTKTNITTPVVRVQTREEFEFKRLEPAIGVEIAYVEGLEGKNIMMFRREDVCVIVGTLMGEDPANISPELDEIHISAICEVMNQMMGASATALSEFLGTIVNISTPTPFDIGEPDDFKTKYFTDESGMVVVRFRLEIEDKLNSEFMNIMSPSLAKRLLAPFEDSMMGETAEAAPAPAPQPAPEPAASTSGGTMSQDEINALLGGASQSSAPEPAAPAGGGMMSQDEINALLGGASQSSAPEPAPTPQPVPTPQPAPAPQPVPQAAPMPQGGQQPFYSYPPMGMDPMMLQLLNQMQQTQMQMMEMMKNTKPSETASGSSTSGGSIIRPLSSTPVQDDSGEGGEDKANQEMLMKVPLEISVEIGRTKRLVKDILEFTQGTLVVLDKMAGEQVDLFVNGQCIARGDIVVVEDNFGIRITEIVAKELNPESL
jgi:flagellar motor switch protein FliN/FliY